ncbi:hypothetical protein GCM10028796_14060 [Ramlibacter monticola]|uniref:Porin n=1 Tax=Ramlibacter monticola TaxID=1926872 RepID=A0A936YX87_9BURK|nr:porin [Ramlibacter monticola]MBL0390239.1 porin [Ramlibacter monticola]
MVPTCRMLVRQSDEFGRMAVARPLPFARTRVLLLDPRTFRGLKAGFSRFAVMGVHDVSKAGPSKAKATTPGATYTMNVTTVRLGWGLVDVDGVKAENLLGVGAVYTLSKRTSLYADFAHKIFPTQSANTYGLGIAHGF